MLEFMLISFCVAHFLAFGSSVVQILCGGPCAESCVGFIGPQSLIIQCTSLLPHLHCQI